MTTVSLGKASYRRRWVSDVTWPCAIAALTTAAFWLTDLDLAVARAFYRPGNPGGPFPMGHQALWVFIYRLVPFLTVGLGLTGMALLAASFLRPRFRRARMQGLFIVLSLALGPGLVVNSIFKEHFGRPRPRQTIEFGGQFQYQPPLRPSPCEGCHSFPSGHSSVGFAFCALYFIYRRKRPGLAGGWLAFSILLGLTIGAGRMAAGAHFLSDVLWSGYFAYIVSLCIYYLLLPPLHRLAEK